MDHNINNDLLTIFCCLVLNKWFVSAVITFVILGVLAFFIPNFQDIKYQPLLGYAAFLAIMSLLISFLLWYFTRNWRKERKARKLEKQIEKYGYEALNFAVKIKIIFDNYMHKSSTFKLHCSNNYFESGGIQCYSCFCLTFLYFTWLT